MGKEATSKTCSNPPDDVKESLIELRLKLRSGAGTRLVLKGCLSAQDRRDFEAMQSGDIVDFYSRKRHVPSFLSIVELARNIGLVADHQADYLRRKLGASPVSDRLDSKPDWDRDRSIVQLDGFVVRRIRSISVAANIVPILDKFQELGWPPRIPDPIPGKKDAQRLREAIASLNERLKRMRFHADGTGAGILWERRRSPSHRPRTALRHSRN